MNKKLRIAIIFVVFLLLGYIRDIFLPTLISSIQLPLPFSSYYILFSNIITFVISVFVLAAMTRNSSSYSKRLIVSLKGNIVLYFGIVFLMGIIETYLRSSILVLMLGRVIVFYLYAIYVSHYAREIKEISYEH